MSGKVHATDHFAHVIVIWALPRTPGEKWHHDALIHDLIRQEV
jgi:hypothetical protein